MLPFVLLCCDYVASFICIALWFKSRLNISDWFHLIKWEFPKFRKVTNCSTRVSPPQQDSLTSKNPLPPAQTSDTTSKPPLPRSTHHTTGKHSHSHTAKPRAEPRGIASNPSPCSQGTSGRKPLGSSKSARFFIFWWWVMYLNLYIQIWIIFICNNCCYFYRNSYSFVNVICSSFWFFDSNIWC